ncbi:hypothetical protein PAECIP111891_06735 [Paenibacillus allorhizoplanae]|uniref:DUF2188 domain-containing protein n=1 Tax=Paenibacillus allorhizoplanae TaxID=2905648 RepID=A0ABN8H9W1_9BACL|nr:DUF2188 domain-containing protein [Paenibacillus allorhizoplanae]CAH1230724.1 hypothetical protein PAECIP111891_06735 [Paenibacillus allorhizoplanae]
MATKKPGVHTVPNPKGGWDNKQGGKVVSHGDTKKATQDLGRVQAIKDKTEHRIHNLNGQIAQSNSYGNDPNPPKDKK